MSHKQKSDWKLVQTLKTEIGAFKLSPLEKSRLNYGIVEQTNRFLDVAAKKLSMVREDGANLINIDEAKAEADVLSVSRLSGDARAAKHGYLKPENDVIRTLVMAVNAKGDVLTELRIFKDPGNTRTNKITLGGTRKQERDEWPVFYAVTENGYIDSNLWLDLLKRVEERHELFYLGLKPVLLLDHQRRGPTFHPGPYFSPRKKNNKKCFPSKKHAVCQITFIFYCNIQ